MINNKHYAWKEVEEYVAKRIAETNYQADISSAKTPYSIIMPPPNVTGYLHMGHALVTTLQDVLVRYKRMSGFDVFWQPGVDHAGIATQVIVEKQLFEKGLTRYDVGRDKFISIAYEWKDHSADKIIDQIKKMGASADFSYVAFTMDEQSIAGVNRAFITLYEEGLIYQDDRLVNWDCKLQTAISDLEVENREVTGKLYYLRYYFADSQDYIVVATTRPETIFGDVAVAVNSQDTRYSGLIGKEVIIPIVGRKIKIISEDYANMDKGSGAVKITPAHDFNDFEVGKRHNLEVINILNKDGTLNEKAGISYRGLDIAQAREKITIELEEKFLIEKIEKHVTVIPYGDRSSSVIEPLLTKQWFLDAKVLAKEAIEVVKSGKIEFVPKSWENLYFEWMNNIQPWCISRQLWWGHRVPVYYGRGQVFVAENMAEAQVKAEHFFGEKVDLYQDEDVLDTWFSSALWPFITMGWPQDSEKLRRYYPTDVLVTAFDIIFFWVARMIMMGVFFMKEVPFKKVYIHALIRDEKGQKMSKSKGNVIDPLDIMNKYGTDALRFALIAYSGQGRDIKLSEKTVEGYRNFVTKIWNSYKFSHQNGFYYNKDFSHKELKLNINKWILVKLEDLQKSVDKYFDSYRFNDVANSIYQFVWGEYCDWYLELSKTILYDENRSNDDKKEVKECMGFVFEGILRIIHPLMPFISQYLFEQLHNDKVVLGKESLPKYGFGFTKEEIEITNLVVDLVSSIRSLRVDLNIPPYLPLKLAIQCDKLPNHIIDNMETIKRMARLDSVQPVVKLDHSYVQDIVNKDTIGIALEGIVDLKKECLRLIKNKESSEKDLKKLEDKLLDSNFLLKANKEVVDNFKEQVIEIKDRIVKINAILLKISR